MNPNPSRSYPKKITTAMIGLKTEKLQQLAEAGNPNHVPVARIYGRVHYFTTESGTFGPYNRYRGEFEAVNLETGDIYRSRTLLVPQVCEVALDEAIAAAREEDEKASVEFAFDLTVEFYNNPNPTGTRFRFGVNSLIEPVQEDPLSKIGSQFGPVKLISSVEPEPKKGGTKEKKK